VKRIAIAILVLLNSLLYAGDVATFANLGFSNDSKYFMFGLYGIIEDGSGQYAELHLVDVQGNRFVPGGSHRASYDQIPDAGQTGFGALVTLFRANIERSDRYDVNHMESGRLLYLLIDGDEPKSELSFRDFETGRSFEVELRQSTSGSNEAVRSAFHINLTVSAGGLEDRFTIGLPDYMREGVTSYRIRRIYASPDDSALVFVIEKFEHADSGHDIRYMVETVRVR